MSTVFYPGMGCDIVTPLVCVDNVQKIIATGPIEQARFGKGALEKSVKFMCDLVFNGNNEFYEGRDVDDDHFIEFLVHEGELVKKYNFKTKGMYLIQFKYNDRLVTLNYYYNALPEAREAWPFHDKIDYVIHKGYKLNVFSEKKNNFLKSLRPMLKEDTKLIGTKDTLRGVWKTAKDNIPAEPIQGYQFVVDQTKYRSEGQFLSMYEVDIRHGLGLNE